MATRGRKSRKAQEFAAPASVIIDQQPVAKPSTEPLPESEMLKEMAWSDPRRLYPYGYTTPYNPDELVGRHGLRIYTKMRHDDQIKMALKFKKSAILSTGWEVCSPEGEDEDYEPAVFLRACFNEYFTGTLGRALRTGPLSALDYGFSVSEQVYATAEGGDFSGMLILKDLKSRAPWSFSFSTDTYGNLREDGLRQDPYGMGAGGVALGSTNPLPPEKFFIYVNEFEFGNWYGTSDLKAAHRYWWAKDNVLKWLSMLLEKYGISPLLALIDPKAFAEPGAKETLRTVLKNMQAATVGHLPRPAPDALEIWTDPNLAKNAAEVFKPVLEYYDQQMAKSLLVPALIGATPDSKEGSYARSETHFNSFMVHVLEQRSDLEEDFNEQVIRPLVRYNYGDNVKLPRWRIIQETDEARIELFNAWSTLVSKGIVVSQPEDEAHIRAAFKFPTREEDAETSEPPEEDEPESEYESEDDSEEDTSRFVSRFAAGRKVRAPNKFEKFINFSAVEDQLISTGNEYVDRIGKIIETARDRMAAKVRRDYSTGVMKSLTVYGMTDIRRELKEMMRGAQASGATECRAELKRAGIKAPKLFAAKVQPKQNPSFIPRDAIRYLDDKAFEISGTLGDAILKDAKQAILTSIKSGETVDQAIDRLREAFDPYVGNPAVIVDGEQTQPYRMETIVRTNATEAYNQGRLVTMRDPELSGLVTGVEYSAILDDRTTEVCASLDGRVFNVNDPDLTRLTPPNHFNCRSLLVPVTLDATPDQSEYVTAGEAGKALDLADPKFV